ncbi:hypothetical protein BG011_007977 [Mortierella polycephala]|uniref:PCI domain-containing protein n=1 Tax=Mortierella polycephala TaxID=41804 RepID=A0A9P6TXI5_9FUNG|nr:hypothetical protein BG011_007977 [Mortierella polycephala]
MEKVKSFAREVLQAYNQKDKDAICDLIMLDDNNPQLEQLQQALYSMTESSIRVAVEDVSKNEPRSLKDMIISYLNFSIASAVDSSSFVDVYELLSKCYASFSSLYQAHDAQWLTPLLMNLSYSLVDWAILADKEKPNAKELRISDAAAKHLSKSFNTVISDKVPNALEDSKKMALFYLANLLKSTRLIPTMMSNISVAGVKLSDYPMSQQVTYRYYVGRYHLYQLDLRRAERDLSFAFRNRPSPSLDESENEVIYKNSRLILIYLTACRLCLGRLPSLQLLQVYRLEVYFAPFIRAIKKGDLGILDRTLAAPDQMAWLVKKEIFFLLKEKLRVLCWRSLICSVTRASQVPNKPAVTRIPLQAVLDIVLALTKDNSYDIWDIECITASLLDQVCSGMM